MSVGKALSFQVMAFLEAMLEKPGRPFSRRALLEIMNGASTETCERAVNTHINRLRKALRLAREPNPIRSVRGLGYAIKWPA
jgi:two-component system phosphate regulon response regulator PhoB